MTLSRERVHSELAVAGEAGQFLTNTDRSGTDHRPDQFKIYWGTCSAPIPLPDSTLTVPRYWEISSRLQVKLRKSGEYILEIAVIEKDLDGMIWASVFGSGWGVSVDDCRTHPGLCTQVWDNGRVVSGDCLSTTPFPTTGKDTEIKLGIALDVGQDRLAFIDVNREIVLQKFDVKFRQPPYPVFGVMPLSDEFDYPINMQLVSGGEISMTDSKKSLIAEALFSS